MQRVPNQIQMTTPQKVMQPAGMAPQQVRFQTPVRAPRLTNPTVRTPRPRASAARPRAQNNVRAQINAGQQQIVTSMAPVMQTPRQRLTLTHLSCPNQVNQVQPIISVGTPKRVVSITSPPRGPAVVRPSTQQPFNKTSPVSQTQITASTSNANANTEDLEDSIQAARITKQPTIQSSETFTIVQQNQSVHQTINETDNRIVTLQSGTQMSVAEYKQRQAQTTTKQLTGIKPISRGVVPTNRQPRFAAPNTVRAQRPLLVRFFSIQYTEIFHFW